MMTGEFSKHAGGDVWRMVFIDDDNACGSQMAEAIGAKLAQPQFVFASGGLSPASSVDAGLVEFLGGKDIDISRSAPRSLDHVTNLEFAYILVALSPDANR